MEHKSNTTNILVKLALLSAVAAILLYFAFPIFPAFDWLWIDFSDIPAVIAAFAYGPTYGVIVEAVKTLIIFLIRGSVTGGIGEFANFIIGAAFVVTAGSIYSKNRTQRNAVFAMITATVTMLAVAIAVNYLILIPLYRNFVVALREWRYVIRYIILGVLPFNLIKGALVTLITSLIYKRIAVIIDREEYKAEK